MWNGTHGDMQEVLVQIEGESGLVDIIRKARAERRARIEEPRERRKAKDRKKP